SMARPPTRSPPTRRASAMGRSRSAPRSGSRPDCARRHFIDVGSVYWGEAEAPLDRGDALPKRPMSTPEATPAADNPQTHDATGRASAPSATRREPDYYMALGVVDDAPRE